MADEGFDLLLPTDTFVDILVRLPTSARRRFRLVCKRWRDVIDERTTERHQVRTKILVFNTKWHSSRVLVFDEEDARHTHEWTYTSVFSGKVDMIGTCNGLICLHDSGQGDGDRSTITVANPITGDTVALPSLRLRSDSVRSFVNYCFGYHPTTGQYKVVHVPSCLSWRRDTVHVLTLDGGSSAWREVTSSTAKEVGYFSYYGGSVCVDGYMYWFDSYGDRVMAFDLKDDERLTSFPGPPGVRSMDMSVAAEQHAPWKLTTVNARLGVVFPSYEATATRVEVWVLDGGGGTEQPRWSQRYTLVINRNNVTKNRRIVMAPHLTYGECILNTSWDMKRLCRSKMDECSDVGDKQLLLSEGTELIVSEKEDSSIRTFAYAETREPLPRVWETRHRRRKRKSGKFKPIGFHRIK